MHLQSQNYVEAALTLKLHADLHDWDLHTYVEPMEDLGLPRQTAFARKETLCLLILDYLGMFMMGIDDMLISNCFHQARGRRGRVQLISAKNLSLSILRLLSISK